MVKDWWLAEELIPYSLAKQTWPWFLWRRVWKGGRFQAKPSVAWPPAALYLCWRGSVLSWNRGSSGTSAVLVIPTGCVDGLQSALQRLLADRKLLQNYRVRTRLAAVSSFGRRESTGRLERVLRRNVYALSSPPTRESERR